MLENSEKANPLVFSYPGMCRVILMFIFIFFPDQVFDVVKHFLGRLEEVSESGEDPTAPPEGKN